MVINVRKMVSRSPGRHLDGSLRTIRVRMMACSENFQLMLSAGMRSSEERCARHQQAINGLHKTRIEFTPVLRQRWMSIGR